MSIIRKLLLTIALLVITHYENRAPESVRIVTGRIDEHKWLDAIRMEFRHTVRIKADLRLAAILLSTLVILFYVLHPAELFRSVHMSRLVATSTEQDCS